tara:strand:- start:94 stop:609 length:516 start_codon:yes stop_codon:yes gene_type:complete
LNKKCSGTGFKKASSFLTNIAQKGFEKKGFSQSVLLTNWLEIIGHEIGSQSKPVKISFDKRSLSSTLILEVNSALGPELEMQSELLREKINRVYGYQAISKIFMKPSANLGYKNASDLAKSETVNAIEPKYREHGSFSKQGNKLISSLKNIKDDKFRETLTKFCISYQNRL